MPNDFLRWCLDLDSIFDDLRKKVQRDYANIDASIHDSVLLAVYKLFPGEDPDSLQKKYATQIKSIETRLHLEYKSKFREANQLINKLENI